MGSDTASLEKCRSRPIFQSPLPAWGATWRNDNGKNGGINFNPRSPHGERLKKRFSAAQRAKFQSPLPAWGATLPGDNVQPPKLFQSPLPAWGATCHFIIRRVRIIISIPAPRMGSDYHRYPDRGLSERFQSPLPAWGATIHRQLHLRYLFYFNPRSPHGERPK